MPCLAHVFQLAIKDFYGKLRITAKNEDFVKIWHEKTAKKQVERIRRKKKLYGIPFLLAKVSTISNRPCNRLLTFSNRFARLLLTLTVAMSDQGYYRILFGN